jgi:iron complex transport system ATP-binding protein
MNPQNALLLADGLTVRTDGVALIANVDLQLQPGEVLGVIGPNGAGKSTLLKALAGVRAVDSGELLLQGKPLHAWSMNARARLLAYLEQRPSVHWPLKVQQVVGFGRLAHNDLAGSYAQQTVEAALASTATTALRERDFHTLSEGEKMRVHLARLLAGEPRIILVDEPTASLDPWHQLQVLDLLRSAAARGAGVVLVMHDLALAARCCDRLLLMHEGRAVVCGAPRDVLDRTRLAAIWRLDAIFDSATLSLVINGRLTRDTQ